jgi:branched-chain amino acid transport system permease protein
MTTRSSNIVQNLDNRNSLVQATSSASSTPAAARLAVYLPPRRSLAAQTWPWVIALGLLVALPFAFAGPLGISVLTQIAIAAVFALAYNVLLGQTGMLSFGHALYFGVGAYATAHLINAFGTSIPVPLAPLAGGAAGLVTGALFALFTVRRSQITFAMISLAIGQLAYAAATIMPGWSGGDAGIRLDPTTAAQWGIDFGSPRAIYFLAALWAWLAALAMYALTRTPLGRLMNATRDNAQRVEFIGYSPTMIRGLALTLSAGFAGIAGSLYALTFQVITTDTLSLQQTAAGMLQAYIGGYTDFAGPILGAIVMAVASAHLSTLTDVWPLYLGVFFTAVIVGSQRGLAGAFLHAVPRWNEARRNRTLTPLVLGLAVRSAAAGLMSGGFILGAEMAQSLQNDNGTPVALDWIKAGLAADPHRAAWWVTSAALVAAAIVLMMLRRRRDGLYTV